MEKIDKPRNGIDIFRNYWRGYGKLSVAFWGYGVVGTFILYFFAMLGSLLLLPTAYQEGRSLLESAQFSRYLTGVYILLLGYQFVVWILIWRNSKNASRKIFGYIAKASVVVGILGFLSEIHEKI